MKRLTVICSKSTISNSCLTVAGPNSTTRRSSVILPFFHPLNSSSSDGLKRHGRQIDAILISHPDLLHCGMLPYLSKLGITCPVFMTMPACKMGQMFLYDFVLSRTAVEDFEMFTLDDVDAIFDRTGFKIPRKML